MSVSKLPSRARRGQRATYYSSMRPGDTGPTQSRVVNRLYNQDLNLMTWQPTPATGGGSRSSRKEGDGGVSGGNPATAPSNAPFLLVDDGGSYSTLTGRRFVAVDGTLEDNDAGAGNDYTLRSASMLIVAILPASGDQDIIYRRTSDESFWYDADGAGDWTQLGGTGITIGDPITGGTANCILFEDASNNVAEDPDFTYDSVTQKFQLGPVPTNSLDSSITLGREVDNTGSGFAHGFSDSSNVTRSTGGPNHYGAYDARFTFDGAANFLKTNSFQSAAKLKTTYSGTISEMAGFAYSPTILGGTVNKLYGLYLSSPITAGGTGAIVDNYALYIVNQGAVPSGDNYAIYSAATQHSYLAGPLRVAEIRGGAASGDDLLLVSTTHGTKGNIRFGSADGMSFDEANTRLGIGAGAETNSAVIGGSTFGMPLAVHTSGTGDLLGLANVHSSNTASLTSYLTFLRSRTSGGSPAVVSANDYIGEIVFAGHDGTDYEVGAAIIAKVDGTPGNNDMPGRLEFYTTPDGSATTLERLRIQNDGVFRFRSTTKLGTAQSANNTLLLSAYDVDGAVYTDFITLTANNTPTCDLSSAVTSNGQTIVTTTATQTLTNKRITKRTGTVASSATPTINTDNVDYFSITALATNITSMTTNLSGTPTTGQTLWIAITGDATPRSITWGASFEASAQALPTGTNPSNRMDIGFIWNEATSKWRCVAST